MMKRYWVLGLGGLSLCMALPAAAIDRGDPVRGQELSAACIACHGEDGNSPDPQYPKLAGQHADYMARMLRRYRDTDIQNPIMNGMASGLSDADIWDLAAYYAEQEGPLHTPPRRR
ncbi:c-type cytochrome [Alkalilimnicola ehrlichii MLHE-1]|uniref:Cytochrome c, class I n=1 Tax=Alkalilimnicola ehrlichii (strain ATCC BAA-1101 / DSM 17681 / MLHE-1) TaxID=187272 RepID=Q0ABA9_ALKEH|nr:cytochrome c [Alkalilimnicola ehrlichii]ABI55878.1 cytochrome c, class I [Alkalilimnicola ehrlichii MLHE-1]